MERYAHGGDRYRNIVTEDFSININPLGMPKAVKQAIANCSAEMEYYPDPFCEQLAERVAKKRGISKENVIFGNGASELIYTFIRAINPKKAWIPVPSFTEYERALQACNTAIEFFPLSASDDFLMDHQLAQIIQSKEEEALPDIIMICNPNNPNGRLVLPEVLKQLVEICRERSIYLVVDECFLELNGAFMQSAVGYMKDNPYLFVLDAFTKTYAMPGIRLGMGYSMNFNILKQMHIQMPQWNVSGIAQLAGIKALEEAEYLESAILILKEERKWLAKQLKQLGCYVFQSDANYILFQSEKNWKKLLLERGILIRDCQNYRGLQKGYYRVAVKTREKNETLIKAMKQVLMEF